MSASPAADSPQSLYQKSGGRDIHPIILDASQSPISTSDLAERVDQNAGLLANPGISAALMSISGYGKSYSASEGYEISNNHHPNDMYLAYAQQGTNSPHLHAHAAYNRTVGSSTSYPAYRNGSPHDAQNAWEAATQAQQMPEIVSWSPKFGPQGTKIAVHLRSAFPIDTSSMNLEVRFGNAKLSALNLVTLPSDGTCYQYRLLVDAPAYASTAWNTYEVPLTVDALDHAGNIITSIKLDEPFSYIATPLQESPAVMSRKRRRLSDGSEQAQDFPAKRVATIPAKMESNYVAAAAARPYTYDQQTNTYVQSSPSPHLSMATNNGYSAQAMPHQTELIHPSPSQLHALATPQHHHRQVSPHARSWSSSTHGPVSRSPSVAASNTARHANTMTPASPAIINPKLVRTSQMSQSPSPAATPAAITSAAPTTGSFNPYAMYPHKAQLRINGDLDAMTTNWTPEERNIKRRLVQFWRSQSGSTISANFAPVAPEDRRPNATCISCIWWEAKDQYYVTSVDTIYLLESLVAVRFTVEEKNRIRRNLEGFRPMTVSKGKSDSEDFFKLIMGFPNPKPRNIEKDVKVYSWKILTLALKKIIGKYSASYASITSSNTSNTPSSVPSYQSAQAMTGHHPGSAPQWPIAGSAPQSMPSYHSPIPAASVPAGIAHHHHHQHPAGAPIQYTTSPTGVPTVMAPAYPLHAYPQAQAHPHSSLMPYVASPHLSHQPQHQLQQQPSSWDSALSMQSTAGMAQHGGMYALASSNGMGAYQMTHNAPGS